MVKNLLANAGDIGSDNLEKEMATQSSILAWEIPWTEEPGGLQSIVLQRVRHNFVIKQQQHAYILNIYGLNYAYILNIYGLNYAYILNIVIFIIYSIFFALFTCCISVLWDHYSSV